LRSYFDTVRHHIVLEKVARRVDDDAVLRLLRLILKASGRHGVPQGGVISPLLSNVYVTEVDGMLERAKAVTRHQQRTSVEDARFADDLVVFVTAHPQQRWLRTAVEQRLREELATLQVEVNEEKSRRVDLSQGESFGFLGFEFRRIRSRRGRWMPLRTPLGKKRTALLQTLKPVFRSHRSRPVGAVIARINSILQGWVQYFAFGHASRGFSYVRDWVEKKVRSHVARERQRHGFGWKRWSRAWLYGDLGLFHESRVTDARAGRAFHAEAAP
jgi:RNA-directed DNA polymerase